MGLENIMDPGNKRDLVRNSRHSAVDKGAFSVMSKMADRIKSLELQLKMEKGKNAILQACIDSAKKG